MAKAVLKLQPKLKIWKNENETTTEKLVTTETKLKLTNAMNNLTETEKIYSSNRCSLVHHYQLQIQF